MPIDNTTWHARIGMFCILKPFLKSKSNIRKFLAYFTLIIILHIILFYLNSTFSLFSCIAIKRSTSYLCLLKKLPKMVKVIILLSLCLPKIDVCVPLPPVYVCEVWDYNKANVENIKKAVSNFNWNIVFENRSGDQKVELLQETLNVFQNCIPNKKIKYGYCQAPWMTDNIKKSLKQRSKLTKMFYKNGQRNSDHTKVLEKSEECMSLISEAKKNYILKMTSKLEDSNTASKT